MGVWQVIPLDSLWSMFEHNIIQSRVSRSLHLKKKKKSLTVMFNILFADLTAFPQSPLFFFFPAKRRAHSRASTRIESMYKGAVDTGAVQKDKNR